MSVPENPKQTKNPITLKIKFKSSSLEQFIERYSVDVSKSGIFIRTKEPLAVGTQLKFEFQLQDGNPLLSGEGTVVWNRAFDPSRSSVAPGMGVRFEKLSADSQRVLERILAEKARRPDSNLESRFDAGVRALREGSVSDAQLTSQATPKGDNGSFGDEPTRAMAADQVNKLAEAMQEEDMPTRQGAPPPDLTDEVRRAVGAAAESAKNMMPMTPMTPLSPSGPPANLGRTLLGQGFMMAPRGGSISDPSSPSLSSRDMPSVEILSSSRENSQSMSKPGISGHGDSAKTPTAPVDEQRVHIADSHRTPTGAGKPGAVSGPAPDAISKPSISGVRPAEPLSRPQELGGLPPPPVEQPLVVAAADPVRTTDPGMGKKSSSAVGLIVGIVVLLGILAALAFVFLNNNKGKRGTGAVGTTDPGASGTPTIATNPATTGDTTPGKTTDTKIEPSKLPEPTSVPVKPAEPIEGVEITTDPPGAHIDFAGKTYGPTPARVPHVTAGSKLTLSLRGYQEAKIPFRTAPDESKPLFFKLTAIERVIEINSTPKGADVVLDGKKVGKTPLVLKKVDTAKVHQIEVRRPGFAAWTHNVSDTESFVVKNRKEVLSLNAILQASEEGGKKGAAKPAKHDGAPAEAPATGAAPTPTEAAKPTEAAPAPTPAPEPAKEAPNP